MGATDEKIHEIISVKILGEAIKLFLNKIFTAINIISWIMFW